jgi:peptide/nickel transport system permease protein
MVIVWWPIYARLIRGEVLAVKEKEYIRAVQALGARPFKIILLHVLPNTIDVVVVRASIDFGNAVMFCAALSFIGLGAQPPQPEWGAMVTTGRDYLRDAWWLVTFPGLAIFLTVMGFNLLGDSLRDFLDPKLRGER